jgi:Tfp pilus assembly protein PilN
MAQQINLHIPILLQPRKQFSAGAMARALLTLVLALAGLGAWMATQNRRLQHEDEQLQARQRAEQAQLDSGMAAQRQHSDRASLQQQLHALELGVAQQQQWLAELERGRARPGLAHSDLLALVARSVPPAAWVTELRLGPEQIEIDGMTLEPAALQAWITQLSASPALQGRALAEVRVEEAGRLGSGLRGTGQGEPLKAAALPQGQGWAFRVVANRADAASPKTLEGRP